MPPMSRPATKPTAISEPILAAQNVTIGYGPRVILQSLDLAVGRGEIYALLGANGAGKTTTLGLFLGFVRPKSGRLQVDGIDPVSDPDGARRRSAYIPENVALYEHLSASENLSYFLDLAGQPNDRARLAAALLDAGLDSAAHGRRVGGFSKGMRQKVAIALALARQVPVLLLDEPTTGLDPHATAEFHRLLQVLRDRGVTTLMVTHDLLSAADVADRIGFIADGRLVEEVAAIGHERFDVLRMHRQYAGEALS